MRSLVAYLTLILILVAAMETAWAAPEEPPSGDLWRLIRILPGGDEEAAGDAILLEGFSGPVTFLHNVAGAEAIRLETPAGPVETRTYRCAHPAMDLVVLEAAPDGAAWPLPQPVTIEVGDTLRTFTRDTPQGYRSISTGPVEVPTKLQILHVPLSARGPAPIFEKKGRLVGLGGQVLVPEGMLGYAVLAKDLLALREKDKQSAAGRPIQGLAGLEPAWLDPRTPAGGTLVGALLVRAGQIKEGFAYLESAAEEKLAETVFEIGVAYNYMRERNQGLEAFRSAAEIRPCYTRALIHQGAEHFSFRRYDEAEKLYLAAQECDSSFARVHLNLGSLAHVRGHKEQAEQRFRKALELDPDYDAARFNLAVLLKANGNIEEAQELLKAMRANGSQMARRLAEMLEGS